jgi:hypothetical protein
VFFSLDAFKRNFEIDNLLKIVQRTYNNGLGIYTTHKSPGTRVVSYVPGVYKVLWKEYLYKLQMGLI